MTAPRIVAWGLAVAVCAVVVAGCGARKEATYHDPNTTDVTASTEVEPFAQFGNDSYTRVASVAQMRGRLRVLAALARGPKDAGAINDELLSLGQEDVPAVTGAVALYNPKLAARIMQDAAPLAALGSASGGVTAGQLEQLAADALALENGPLRRAARVVTPPTAQASPQWATAVVVQLLQEVVAAQYEQAYVGGDAATLASSYRLAWGMLDVLRGGGYLDGMPSSARGYAMRKLEGVAGDLFADITPGSRPDAEQDTERINDLGDDITSLVDIDTTPPEPTKHTLRSIDQARDELHAAQAAHASRDAQSFSSHLHAATAAYQEAASGIASVDPSSVATLDHAFGVELAALLPGSPFAAPPLPGTPALPAPETSFSNADAALDSARSQVSTELDALAEE